MTAITRGDFNVQTVDGVNIAIREVRPDAPAAGTRTPLLLLHGTRIPGISEYDLPVPNGSFAADMAARGHVCFVPDARGYGRSDRPEAMSRPPSESRPLARGLEITRDVDAAVDALRATTSAEKVALMGWGVGATILIMYAALWPEKVSHIVLYNAIYGGGTEFPRYRNAPMEDPDRPGRFNVAKYGGYAFNKLDMLLDKWDQSIPIEDKDAWRDPAVANAFVQALIDGDPTSRDRDPVTFRCPNGMLEDSFYIGRGHKLVHANQVTCKVMILRPALDYFSRPEDVAALREDLTNAEDVVVWEPANTTHYLILDRPERGRTEALERISAFIG
jgi:pimeloyl-ACP methyl ester carboxylesterase